MELNNDGDLNTGGSNESVENSGTIMNTIDFRTLQDGASLPAEFTLVEGAVGIEGGFLKGANGDVPSYLLLDSSSDGIFTTVVGGGGIGTFKFSGVIFRASDLGNYHNLIWQTNNSGLTRYGTSVDGVYSTVESYTSNLEGNNKIVGLMVICEGEQITLNIADYASLVDINDPDDPAWQTLDVITSTYNQDATYSGVRVGNEWHEIPEYSYTSTSTGGGTVEPETPPTAVYDGDKSGIVAGSNVTMVFSGSSAVSPATIASYNVTQVSGGAVTLTGSGNSRSYTAPSESFAQDLVFQLIVTDSDGLSSSPVTFTHSILAAAQEPVNQAPTANAGPNQSVAAGVLVQVSASASSDGDGTIVGYKWRETTNSGVVLSSTTAENISFTSPVSDIAQKITLELIATDDDGVDSAPVYVDIDVAAEVDTTPPVIILEGWNIALQVGETFVEPGYQAFNNKGVDITDQVTVTGSTSTAFPRTGTLEYNVVADGIAAETQTRIFTVTAESELLEAVSKQKFLRDNTVISAFTGRSNIEELKFKLASTNAKIALDNQGYYDFDENETQKVIVVTDDGEISSENGDVEWEGSSLFVRFGAFSSRKSQLSARVVVFLAGDERGVVIAGPGLNANLLVKFN